MKQGSVLRGKISSFQQASDESIPEAWERFQDYVLACLHHGMQDWLLLQSFYHGMAQSAHEHLNAAAGGAFLSLTATTANGLVEKMVSNQSWRSHPTPQAGHAHRERGRHASRQDGPAHEMS